MSTPLRTPVTIPEGLSLGARATSEYRGRQLPVFYLKRYCLEAYCLNTVVASVKNTRQPANGKEVQSASLTKL